MQIIRRFHFIQFGSLLRKFELLTEKSEAGVKVKSSSVGSKNGDSSTKGVQTDFPFSLLGINRKYEELEFQWCQRHHLILERILAEQHHLLGMTNRRYIFIEDHIPPIKDRQQYLVVDLYLAIMDVICVYRKGQYSRKIITHKQTVTLYIQIQIYFCIAIY